MCQQWFSIIGLILDVTGFLTIAVEWHHMFQRDVYLRQKRIERDFAKNEAEAAGVSFDDDADMEYTHWREFQRLLRKDTRYRAWLFYTGTTLVVLGFIAQLPGNLPSAIGFRSY